MASLCLSIKSNEVSTNRRVGCLGPGWQEWGKRELLAPFRARLTLFAGCLGLILLRVPQRVDRAHPIDQATGAPDGFAGLLRRRAFALGEVVGDDHRSAGAGGRYCEPR